MVSVHFRFLPRVDEHVLLEVRLLREPALANLASAKGGKTGGPSLVGSSSAIERLFFLQRFPSFLISLTLRNELFKD